MKSLVTIIVPIYNVERYIERCVNSILNQTYTQLEVILVNDGSLDNCPQICNEYEKKDPRVKVIHKENGGLSDARNFGIDAATGDFLLFIDSDDYIELNMIEKTLAAAKLYKSDIVTWGYFVDYVDNEEKLLRSVVHSYESGVYAKNQLSSVNIDTNLISNLGYAWNKMYRHDFIRNNKLKFTRGLSLVEDIVFNALAFSLSEITVFLEDSLVHYMKRPRETLGTKLYPNYFQLKEQGLNSVEKMLLSWGVDKGQIIKVTSLIGYGTLKNLIASLSKADNLSLKQKKEYLDSAFKSSKTIIKLDGIEFLSIKDKVILKLMKKQKSLLLIFSYKLFQKKVW